MRVPMLRKWPYGWIARSDPTVSKSKATTFVLHRMDLAVDISKLPHPVIALIKRARRYRNAHLRLHPNYWRSCHLNSVSIIFDVYASPFPCATIEQVPIDTELDAILRGYFEPSLDIYQLLGSLAPPLLERPPTPLPPPCHLTFPEYILDKLFDLFEPQQIFPRHYDLTLQLGSTSIDLGCTKHRLIASIDLTPPHYHTCRIAAYLLAMAQNFFSAYTASTVRVYVVAIRYDGLNFTLPQELTRLRMGLPSLPVPSAIAALYWAEMQPKDVVEARMTVHRTRRWNIGVKGEEIGDCGRALQYAWADVEKSLRKAVAHVQTGSSGLRQRTQHDGGSSKRKRSRSTERNDMTVI